MDFEVTTLALMVAESVPADISECSASSMPDRFCFTFATPRYVNNHLINLIRQYEAT